MKKPYKGIVKDPICYQTNNDEVALVGQIHNYDEDKDDTIITSRIVRLDFYADNHLEVHTENSRYGCNADEFLKSLFGQFNVYADTQDLFIDED